MSIKVSKMHQKVIDKQNLKEGVSNNVFWDEAKSHYNSCMAAIEQVEGQLVVILSQIAEDAHKLSLVQDPIGLSNNINILNKDIKEHFERLNQIHSKHEGRTGGTVTPDDHMLLLQIHGEYAEALDIYQANIVPTVSYILEQIGAAEEIVKAQELEALAKAQLAQQEAIVEEPVRDFSQDTAVMDVEFTEIKKG